MESAIDLLGLFESELEAIIEDTGWRNGYGFAVANPILIQFESLRTTLEIDGGEIVLNRTGGSKQEFEDLCEFVCDKICADAG